MCVEGGGGDFRPLLTILLIESHHNPKYYSNHNHFLNSNADFKHNSMFYFIRLEGSHSEQAVIAHACHGHTLQLSTRLYRTEG